MKKEIAFIESQLRTLQPYVCEKFAQRKQLSIETKSNPNDLLTEVDVTVQRRTAIRLAEEFPGDILVGEEEGQDQVPSGSDARCWVMDPIDGTYNFVRGVLPIFGISLAFACGNDVIAAGVLLPVTDDLFLATKGGGAFHNGHSLHTSDVKDIDLANIELDFSGPACRKGTWQIAPRIVHEAGALRISGSAVVGLCSVATGDSDAYIHVGLHPWDYAASMLIIREAGGQVTDFDGKHLPLFGACNGILATNGHIHEKLLFMMKAL